MTIPPVSGISGAVSPAAVTPAADVDPGPGFGSTIGRALEAVSDAERVADVAAEDVASGGDTSVHELMVAMTKASLSVDLLVQARNRAVEAYQEIMRMQI